MAETQRPKDSDETAVVQDTTASADQPGERLSSEDSVALCTVWRTVSEFHKLVSLSPFPKEELDAALESGKLCPLLIELHISLLRVLLEEEFLALESGIRSTSVQNRQKLSVDLLKVGSWELLLANFITYSESDRFKFELNKAKSNKAIIQRRPTTVLQQSQTDGKQDSQMEVDNIKVEDEGKKDGQEELDEDAWFVKKGWMVDCMALVQAMIDQPGSFAVRSPGHQVLNMSEKEYEEIVQEPMDLSEVKRKAAAQEYKNLGEFLDNLQTIWENCFACFPQDSEEVLSVKQLIQTFDVPLAMLEERYNKAEARVPKLQDSDNDSNSFLPIKRPRGRPRIRPAVTPTPTRRGGRGRGRGRALPPSATTTTPRSASTRGGGRKRRGRGRGASSRGVGRGAKRRKVSRGRSPATPMSEGNSDGDEQDEEYFEEGEGDEDEDGMDTSEGDSAEEMDDETEFGVGNGENYVADVSETLLHAVARLATVGYEQLDIKQRVGILVWLTDRLVDSDKFRNTIQDLMKDVEAERTKLEDIENNEENERNRVEEEHKERLTGLERELRTFKRWCTKASQYQFKYATSSLVALLKSYNTQLLRAAAKEEVPVASSTPVLLNSLTKMQKQAMFLLGRNFVELQPDGSFAFGTVERVVQPRGGPGRKIVKNPKTPKRKRAPKGARSGKSANKPKSRGKGGSRASGRSSSRRRKDADEHSDEDMSDEDYVDPSEPVLDVNEDGSNGEDNMEQDDDDAEDESDEYPVVPIHEKVQDVEPIFRCVYDEGGSSHKQLSELLQWIVPYDKELGLPETSEREQVPEGPVEVDLETQNTLRSLATEEIINEAIDAAASKPHERYFLRAVDDLSPGEPGDVVLTSLGFGVIEEIIQGVGELSRPEKYVVKLFWGREPNAATAYLPFSAVLYLRVSLQELRTMLEARAEKQREKDLEEVRAENPELAKLRVEVESKLCTVDARVRYPKSSQFGALVVWSFDRFLLLENTELETRWILHRSEDLQMLADGTPLQALRERQLIPSARANDPPGLSEYLSSLQGTAKRVLASLTVYLNRADKTPLYLTYQNRLGSTNSVLPPILDRIPGLTPAEKYDKFEALRHTLLRVEENLAPFTTRRYREELRFGFLRVVRTFGISPDLPNFDISPLVRLVLQLEEQLLAALSGQEDSVETSKKEESGTATEKDDSDSHIESDKPAGNDPVKSEKEEEVVKPDESSTRKTESTDNPTEEVKSTERAAMPESSDQVCSESQEKPTSQASDSTATTPATDKIESNEANVTTEEGKPGKEVLSIATAPKTGASSEGEQAKGDMEMPFRDKEGEESQKAISPTNVHGLESKPEWMVTLEKAISLVNCGKVAIQEMVERETLESEEELTFVKLCLKAYHLKYAITHGNDSIESLAQWCKRHGWSKTNAGLERHHGKSMVPLLPQSMLEKKEGENSSSTNGTATSSSSSNANQVVKLAPGVVPAVEGLTAKDKLTFLQHWLEIRGMWLEAVKKTSISVHDFLNQLLVLEQACGLLYRSLTFSKCCKLFTDGTLAPPPSWELKVGSTVVYDTARHEFVHKLEQTEYEGTRAVIRTMCKDKTNNVKEELLYGQKGFSPVWNGDVPLPETLGRTHEFTVYLVEYFAGGGEPYCAVTLGPQCAEIEDRTPLKDQSLYFRGRRRLMHKLCRTPKCRKFVIEGNFGYCEDHRETPPAPETTKLKLSHQNLASAIESGDPTLGSSTPNARVEDDETCYICLDGGEVFVCDKPTCSRVYHQDCLKLSHVPADHWECPLHTSHEIPEVEKLNALVLVILGRICALPTASAFLHPVTGQPGYLDEVKRPICLQDMRFKALSKEYFSADQVIADTELLRNNCHLWCNSRFPSLPPMADRILRTMKAAFRRVKGELALLEEKIRTARPDLAVTQRHEGGDETDEGKQASQEDPGEEGKEEEKKKAAGKAVGPKRRRKRRSVQDDLGDPGELKSRRGNSRVKRSAALKARQGVLESTNAAAAAAQPVFERIQCGECANCLQREAYPQLFNGTLVRCLRSAERDSDGKVYQLLPTPQFLIKSKHDAKVWSSPSGNLFGVKDSARNFFVFIVPLSKRFATYIMTRSGWAEVSRQMQAETAEKQRHQKQQQQQQQSGRQQQQQQQQQQQDRSREIELKKKRERERQRRMALAAQRSNMIAKSPTSLGQARVPVMTTHSQMQPHMYAGGVAPGGYDYVDGGFPSARYLMEDPVEVRYAGNWYPAKIVGCVSEGLYTIQYSNGSGGNVGILNLRHPPNSAVAQTGLHVGDPVQVVFNYNWFDAVIVKSTGPTFVVKYDRTGQVEADVDPLRVRPRYRPDAI